ncbi:MAG: hypothetical protein GX227_05470 [Clostridiaceae bacterium]|nr:hypothetical protein [Clostridiaceae bacterium]
MIYRCGIIDESLGNKEILHELSKYSIFSVGDPKPCGRYFIIERSLKRRNAKRGSDAKELLKLVKQKHTVWSSVYNLEASASAYRGQKSQKSFPAAFYFLTGGAYIGRRHGEN